MIELIIFVAIVIFILSVIRTMCIAIVNYIKNFIISSINFYKNRNEHIQNIKNKISGVRNYFKGELDRRKKEWDELVDGFKNL